MRLRPRVDGNHPQIVARYRDQGLMVLSLAGMGRGVPDLLVGYPPLVVLVEVKMPGGTLTPDQVRFHSLWPVVIVTSPEEADAHAQTLRRTLSYLPPTVSGLSGYAEILLDHMLREEPSPVVLPGDGEAGRGHVGRPQETGPQGRARRKNRASAAR